MTKTKHIGSRTWTQTAKYFAVTLECWLFFLLEYIQIIMTLEEAVQHVVMTAIQEVSLFLWNQTLLQHLL